MIRPYLPKPIINIMAHYFDEFNYIAQANMRMMEPLIPRTILDTSSHESSSSIEQNPWDIYYTEIKKSLSEVKRIKTEFSTGGDNKNSEALLVQYQSQTAGEVFNQTLDDLEKPSSTSSTHSGSSSSSSASSASSSSGSSSASEQPRINRTDNLEEKKDNKPRGR